MFIYWRTKSIYEHDYQDFRYKLKILVDRKLKNVYTDRDRKFVWGTKKISISYRIMNGELFHPLKRHLQPIDNDFNH